METKETQLPVKEFSTDPRLVLIARNFSEASGIIVFLVGVLVLIGWQFDVAFLKSVSADFVTMKPNTALGLVFTGVALWFLQEKRKKSWARYLGLGSALAVISIGAVTTLEYLFSVNFGIDNWLFQESFPALFTVFPGRMALITALNFIFIGISLLFLNIKTKRGFYFSDIPAMLAGAMGLLVIVGYLYDIAEFYLGPIFYTPMALHTAVAFCLAGLGVLFARPEGILTRVFVSENLAGITARRLLPLAFLVPLIFGWLEELGHHYGFYSEDFGRSVISVSSITVLATLIWLNGILMEKKEEDRLKTARELVEATEEARRLAFLVENTIEAIAIVDLEDDNSLRYVNRAWEKLFGYSKEEVENKKEPLIIEAVKNDPVLYKKFKNSIASHMPFYAEMEWKKKDGASVPVEVFTTPTQDPNTGEYIWFNTIRDISDRKQSQEKLERAKQISEALAKDLEKFKLAVDAASDHVIITDPDGKILYANKATEIITGYGVSEVVGKEISEVWGGHMADDFYVSMWNKIKNDKKMFVGEITNHKKDGASYVAEVRIAPILYNDGQVHFFVGIERDITKIKAIDKMKTEFASLASHQLRTPLTVIKWYIQLLAENKSAKKEKEYLQQIFSSNEKMIKLVNDLLDVSRIESGEKFAISLKKIDIVPVVRDVVKSLSVALKTRKQKGSIDFAVGFPKQLELSVDENKVRQVFQNIIENSINYSLDKTEVLIDYQQKNDMAVFSIKDKGIGIPKNQWNRVFEKFFRADNTAALKAQGTGLGLYLVKAIVEGHGGKVWFDSQENVGTTFYFSLPLNHANLK